MSDRLLRTWHTDDDLAAEGAVAAELAAVWRCELREFGPFCPVDRYAIRDGRVVGLVEIKCRSHASDDYPTSYLKLRKWAALMITAIGLGCPAIFVVRFTDGIRWVDVDAITPRNPTPVVGGWRNGHTSGDVEPLLQVPVKIMHRLGEGSAP